MKMRNLLGLLAIGGVVVYAQKKRGGEISIEGFKRTARELMRSRGMGQGVEDRDDDAIESRSSSGRGARRAGEETSGYGVGSSSRRQSDDLGLGSEGKLGNSSGYGNSGGFGGGGMGGGGGFRNG